MITMLIMRDYLLRNPEATIMVSEEIQDFTAPYAASFSSRGPNPITPDILKVNKLTKFNICHFFLP